MANTAVVSLSAKPYAVRLVRNVSGVQTVTTSDHSDLGESRIAYQQHIREFTLSASPTVYTLTLLERLPGKPARSMASAMMGGMVEVFRG